MDLELLGGGQHLETYSIKWAIWDADVRDYVRDDKHKTVLFDSTEMAQKSCEKETQTPRKVYR